MTEEYAFHFDVGNSNTGPLGLCARVHAANKADAVERFRQALPEHVAVPAGVDGVVYIEVYLNPSAILERHIDEIDDVED